MTSVMESVDVDVDVRTAYNQWTQFADFPRFMSGVRRVDQLTDTSTHWVVDVGGVRREFDAEITEQHPDERVAWKSVDGTTHAGVVTFHRLDRDHTRVTLQLESQPEGIVEKAGDALGLTTRQAKADLTNFKSFIEARGRETGAWRGDVDPPRTG